MGLENQWCAVQNPIASDHLVYIDQQEVEHVNDFVFLCSVVPGSSADVKSRSSLLRICVGEDLVVITPKEEYMSCSYSRKNVNIGIDHDAQE